MRRRRGDLGHDLRCIIGPRTNVDAGPGINPGPDPDINPGINPDINPGNDPGPDIGPGPGPGIVRGSARCRGKRQDAERARQGHQFRTSAHRRLNRHT